MQTDRDRKKSHVLSSEQLLKINKDLHNMDKNFSSVRSIELHAPKKSLRY